MKKKRKIIIVDDEMDNLSPVVYLLKSSFEIKIATSGMEALEILGKEPDIEILITDQRMPNMTGLELIRICKERHPDIYRILLTAYSDFEPVAKAVNEGDIYHCALKPWDIEDMKEVFNKALKRKDELSIQRHLQSLGTISAALAHELNNPLAAVKGYLQLIEEVNQDNYIEKLIKRVNNGVIHICDLISDITMVVGSDFDSKIVENFNHCIQESVNMVCFPTNVDLSMNLCENIPKFVGYPDQYQRIFSHLLNNALDSLGGENGEIWIKTIAKKDRLETTIETIGNGQSQIQEAIHGYLSTGSSGVGLGLTLSSIIAKACQGELRIDNKDEGGTKFKLVFPIDKL
jgi:signal transduction histidine kinase